MHLLNCFVCYIYTPSSRLWTSLPLALWLHFGKMAGLKEFLVKSVSSDRLWSHHNARRSIHLQTHQFPTNISVYSFLGSVFGQSGKTPLSCRWLPLQSLAIWWWWWWWWWTGRGVSWSCNPESISNTARKTTNTIDPAKFES